MSVNLDRAYVINGHDLYITLQNCGVNADPLKTARGFLELDGRPLEDVHPGVTVQQLRTALTGLDIEIRTSDGDIRVGEVYDPPEAAAQLHARLLGAAREREDKPGWPCCQHCDDERHAALEPPPHRKPCTTCQLEKPAETPRKGPGYKCGAPECAACYPEDDLADDPEINAIRAITGLLDGLGDWTARKRVLDYLTSRHVTQVPF